MSHTYHFLCVDCGEVVDVGKIVDTCPDGSEVPLSFAGWRDQMTSRWIAGQDLWCVLERWHILHRGHEVRMVPEPFLNTVDPDGHLHYVDSAAEVLQRDVCPLPDDERDARNLPDEIANRIWGSKHNSDDHDGKA